MLTASCEKMLFIEILKHAIQMKEKERRLKGFIFKDQLGNMLQFFQS